MPLYNKRCCAPPLAMAAPKLSCSSFVGEVKKGRDNNRLIRDESIKSFFLLSNVVLQIYPVLRLVLFG